MLRFTIRDVLWLTLLVAMGVGWWVDHQKQRSENDRLLWEFINPRQAVTIQQQYDQVWESRARVGRDKK